MKKVAAIGFWSSILAAVMVSLFFIALIASLLKPELNYLGYIPCLFLPWFYTMMFIALHYMMPKEKRVFTLPAVIAGAIYTAYCSGVYYIQLSVIQQNWQQAASDTFRNLAFVPGSAAFALDMLGYVFLCLGVLAASQVFGKKPLEKWLRRVMVINGLFAIPTLIFPLIPMGQDAADLASANLYGSLALLGWCLVFIPVPILLARFFNKHTDD
ncbi:MAG: hypothetical protein HPY53_02400 [Brevinematales bacterium]|nr:hypothetical protein [Brevinematales bacterium]